MTALSGDLDGAEWNCQDHRYHASFELPPDTSPMAHLQPTDVVSGEQYRYALTNFRITNEKVEEQRHQLEEQEKQVALLRARIALLEGNPSNDNSASHVSYFKQGGTSVDDFSIKNAAAQLERNLNRWAADVVRTPLVGLSDIYLAAFGDITGAASYDMLPPEGATAIQVQNMLRHALSEVISTEIINVFMVTNSTEANVQLTRIHEHLFARNPFVAGVWRRQTFSAAVESCSPELATNILEEQLPTLLRQLGDSHVRGVHSILVSARAFSHMLHGSPSAGSAGGDTFYRSFVPEIGGQLDPQHIELVRRCLKSERSEADRVGTTVFPGLVKVSRAGQSHREGNQTVVRRAQAMCECALYGGVEVSLQ